MVVNGYVIMFTGYDFYVKEHVSTPHLYFFIQVTESLFVGVPFLGLNKLRG